MRLLVCDDEELVRSELAYALAKLEPSAEIVEVCDALEALKAIGASDFDALFLDVEMPGLSGLEAMSLISGREKALPVVLVSAHDKHAVPAFERAAVDYLLKPVSEARLRRTLERLRSSAPQEAASTPSLDRLPVYQGEKARLLRLSDVRYFEADRRGVSVATFEARDRFRGTLAECAVRAGPGFLRVHRAFIVNANHVLEITPSFGGTYVLRMDDRARSEVPVSRNYVRCVRDRFGLSNLSRAKKDPSRAD